MAEKTDLNISPYYDDYSESKNFQKVLYRAGRPLQARELTQTQSILQNQVERFGRHIFEEGSLVQGAQTDADFDIYYVKVKSANPNELGDASAEGYVSNIHDKYLQGTTSGVVAKVVTSAAETSTDPLTLFVRFERQGTDTNNSFAFQAGETLREVTIDENGAVSDVSTNNNDFEVRPDSESPIGRSSIANISEGIVFCRGFFCKVDAQKLILEKYNPRASYRVGLSITESIITAGDDSSLNDNASGTTNENAAGADRLKFSLTLAKQSLLETDNTNFIELLRVVSGQIELKIENPIYSEIQNTLARRTFDANGDFVVRQFTSSFREHLDNGTNRGVYSSALGGKEDKFVMQVSSGKAYVKGYEIDKQGTTNIPISKARATSSLSSANTPTRIGNELRVTNVYGYPYFGSGSGSDPHRELKLFPSAVSSNGTLNSEDYIGFARVKYIDNVSATNSGDLMTTASVHNLYLFDVKMFTKISYTGHSGSASAGDKVTGSVSGATGIVAYDNNSDAIYLHDVVGTFVSSDALSSKGVGDFSITAGQNDGVRNYNIDRVRSVGQLLDQGTLDFTANAVVDAEFTLTGSVTFDTGDSDAMTGFGTKFATELKEGDKVVNPSNGEIYEIDSITSDTVAVLKSSVQLVTSNHSGNAVRQRVKLRDQDQTVQILSLPRNYVSSVTPTSSKVKRQEVATVNASGVISVGPLGTNESFASFSRDNWNLSVIESAGGSLSEGQVLDITVIDPSASGGSTQTIDVGQANDNGAKILVSYGVISTKSDDLNKSLHRSCCVSVEETDATGHFYGTAYDHKDISLGVADVFAIRGIYEGVGGNPLPPNATLTKDPTTQSSVHTLDEIIIGQTSDAKARIIKTASSGSTFYYYYLTEATFTENEIVVGQSSNVSSIITNINAGSPDIKERYFLDNGQRDAYYDHAKITLKPGQPVPNNKILIVFDYFTGSGNGYYYSVDSYPVGTSAGDISYDEIPVYSPNKVDVGGLEPDGTYELSDALDFRPSVGSLLGTDLSSTTPDPTSPVNLSDNSSGITADPFEFEAKDFSSTGAFAINTPLNAISQTADLSFYTARIDKIFLHKKGSFQISTGIPSLTPTRPKSIEDSIEMFELFIPPYTADLSKIKVRSKDHRRFTMKDIGKINQRVTNLERLTSLSLLEKDTQSRQILDGDGFDRYKSGFLVDNFRGHKIGDVTHPDYQCAIDTKMGMLRPQSMSQFFDIALNTTDSSGFQQTGDMITLPYTEKEFAKVGVSSRSLNVNPYHVFAFIGNLKLTPESDIWNDTEQLPEVRVSREGNFDALSGLNGLGTVWNSWQTTWVGEPETVSTEVTSSTSGQWDGDPAQGGTWQAGSETTREITETPETQTRTGVTTSVVEDFVETRNDRIVSVSIIPFMRARTIEIDATNLKPGTNHFFFFDGVRIDKYVRPYDANFSQDGGTTVTSGLKTNGNGRLRAYFELPNDEVQRFPTGTRDLKITSSYNNTPNPHSYCQGNYSAQGLLQSNQTEVVSTRNGKVITENTTGQRSIKRRGEVHNTLPTDTTAPTFEEDIPTDTNDQVEETTSAETETNVADNFTELPPPMRVESTEDWRDLVREARWDARRELRGWSDPLAESFLVEQQGGVFLSSIDVYFATKSTHMPVSIEIRNMVNGYPGPIVMPFSTVTKNPSEITTSTDASVATKFTFDSLVYLEEGKEYCFVVYTNSNEYECWISRMGETDITTGEQITGQPYAGSLFLSQNASTWTAEQTDDLKFTMRFASFDVSKTANLYFENEALPTVKLQNNPISTKSGENKIKVYSYMHGMYDAKSGVVISQVAGDKLNAVLEIDSTSGSNGVSGAPTAGTYLNREPDTYSGSGTGLKVDITIASDNTIDSIRIADPGSGYAVGESVVFTNFDNATDGNGSEDLTISIAVVGDTLGGIPVDAINASHGTGSGNPTNLEDITIDAFRLEIDLSSYIAENKLKTGYTANATTLGGGKRVKASRNYYYDALHTLIPSVNVKNTFVVASVERTAGSSPEGHLSGTVYQRRATSEFVTLNDNAYFSEPSVILSERNETLWQSSGKSFRLLLQMASVNKNVSPVIDTQTIGALAIGNRLNNIDAETDLPNTAGDATVNDYVYVPSTEPEGDNNAFVYLTKKVNLKNPASALKVISDNFRPTNTDLKFMYKIVKNDEETPIDDIGFEYFNTDGSPDTVVDNDERNFKEYEYTAENLPEFSAFMIKIVGQGSNTSKVPMVSALRCIATA